MFTLEQINSSWERARQRSADGEVLRRRIAVIGAVAAGFCGLLLAIGLGFVVLVFLAGVVVSAGAVALLRLWPRLRAAGRNGVVSVRDRSRAAHRRLVPIAHTAARGARTAFLEARAHSHELARSTARSSQRAGGGLAQAGHAGASWFARRAARRRLVPIAHTAARGARTAFLEARAHSHELARSSQQAGGGLAQAGRAATLRFARRAALLDPQREAIRLNATGTQHRRSGRYEEAVEYHRQALELLRAVGDRRGVALTQSNLALAVSYTGDDVWAVGLFEEAAATLRELGDAEHEARIMANLGATHRRHGRLEEGDNVLELALSKLTPASSAYQAIEAELRRAS